MHFPWVEMCPQELQANAYHPGVEVIQHLRSSSMPLLVHLHHRLPIGRTHSGPLGWGSCKLHQLRSFSSLRPHLQEELAAKWARQQVTVEDMKLQLEAARGAELQARKEGKSSCPAIRHIDSDRELIITSPFSRGGSAVCVYAGTLSFRQVGRKGRQ